MFVSTMTLLSTGALARGEAQSSGNNGVGMPAPMQGGRGQPCRYGVPREDQCNAGLECVIHDSFDHSYTTGTCQPQPINPIIRPNLGGLGEPCRSTNGNECNPGLVCQYDYVDEEITGVCERRAPNPPQNTGGLDEPCNETGPKCNSDNLMPNYKPMISSWPGLVNPDGSGCVCEQRLMGSPNSDTKLGGGLGVLPPTMGGENQPCRNTYPECNYGLSCQYDYPAGESYWTGTCRYDVQPVQQTGGENQQCNASGPKCNASWLKPKTSPYISSMPGLVNPDGSGCTCLRTNLGSSDPELGLPAPQMGGKGQPCRGNWQDSCNDGLHCLYSKHGQEWQGVCTENTQTGGDGETCNKPPVSPCNDESLTAEYLPMYPSGETCMCKRAEPVEPKAGEKDGPCNKVGAPCNQDNLRPKYTPLLPSGTSCSCQLWLQGSKQPSLGMPAPMMGALNQPCRNTPGHECNYGLQCQYYVQSGGSSYGGRCVSSGGHHPTSRGHEGEPCNNQNSGMPLCYNGLMCRNVPVNGHTEQICTSHDRAFEGDKCGVYAENGHPAQCQNGLQCITAPSGNVATCQRQGRYAQEGKRCGQYAYPGQPRQCRPGLICKTQKLLGTANAGYMSTCEKPVYY